MGTSVGEFLRETRTSRGLTLEQASKATHIRKSYLEALESEQRDELPSAVQGRGFLRLYAGYLGLPAEDLVKAWDGKAPIPQYGASAEVAEPAAETTPPKPESTLPQPTEEILPQAAPPAMPAASPALISPETQQPASSMDREGPIPVEFQDAGPEPAASASSTIFFEIGEKLRKQRELLGLSRAEVERYTRLRQHYLQALEEGRLDQLPSPVQGRGMLSNYAAFLNLDEDALMLRFAEGLQQRRLERMPKEQPQLLQTKKRPARTASPLRRFLTPDLIFGVAVVAAIMFFTVRTALSISAVQSRSSQPTARAIAEILLAPDDLPLTATAPALEGELLPEQGLPGGEENAAGSETQSAVLEVPNPAPSATPQPTLAPINNDPIQLYIIANQRAFLRVMVDGKEKFNGRIVPGNAYAYSGTKRIELLTGNAAAIQVFFNQNDLGTLGVAGQAAGLVFVPGGMATATPVFTATPTPGPAATETPRPTATLQATFTVTPLIP